MHAHVRVPILAQKFQINKSLPVPVDDTFNVRSAPPNTRVEVPVPFHLLSTS